MSIPRRLGRILRAHWGARRHDAEGGFSLNDIAGYADPAPRARERRSEEHPPAVPPEVAAAYRALEVPAGSPRAQVKKSYRRLMKKYHQDRFENDPDRRATAGEVSKRLNNAYERVTDYLDERQARGA